jgi:hypothetical protein
LGVVGPVFEDLRFEFVPLKSETSSERNTYASVKARNEEYGKYLSDFLPPNRASVRVHCDPEFVNYTSGQPNNGSSKVQTLQKLHHGDYLFFLASLAPYDRSAYSQKRREYLRAFQREKKNKYVIGFFLVQGVANISVKSNSANLTLDERIAIQNISGNISTDLVKNNEHCRRLNVSDSSEFTLVTGQKDQSCLLQKAVRLTEKYEQGTFLLNPLGREIFGHDTDTLRGVRWIEDNLVRLLLREIEKTNS